jgi:hypothetical protein
VVALNAQGQWREARRRFDPAHAPFIAHMRATPLGPSSVVILGEASFLLRRGSSYDDDAVVVHIDGDVVEPLAGVLGFGMSRDRRWLALATVEGITVSAGFGAANARTIAWPDGQAMRPTSLDIDNDGKTIVIANDQAGVWCVRGGKWQKVFPRPGSDASSEADDGLADVIHAALSPDGTLLAYGWQAAPGHFVEHIDGDSITQVGVVGTVSDYPYHVRFTDDSLRLLSNTRHMLSGATVCVAIDQIRGKEAYDDLPDDTPHTDDYLRAYGMTVLPGPLAQQDEPIAWIGGAGWSHAARLSGGKPVFTHFFGSALNAFDYDPVSKLAVVASSSGMLHVLDPAAVAEPGRERGYRPRREKYRWIFWEGLEAPIRW